MGKLSFTLTQKIANIVWPNEDGQEALAKTKVQESDGKQPANYPNGAGESVVFYLYFFHNNLLFSIYRAESAFRQDFKHFIWRKNPAVHANVYSRW